MARLLLNLERPECGSLITMIQTQYSNLDFLRPCPVLQDRTTREMIQDHLETTYDP